MSAHRRRDSELLSAIQSRRHRYDPRPRRDCRLDDAAGGIRRGGWLRIGAEGGVFSRQRLTLIRRFAPPSPASGRRDSTTADKALGAPPRPLAGEGWGEGRAQTKRYAIAFEDLD